MPIRENIQLEKYIFWMVGDDRPDGAIFLLMCFYLSIFFHMQLPALVFVLHKSSF